MPHAIKLQAYTFDELSERAKDKARDWYRSCIDSDEYSCVTEDFVEIAKIIGIELTTHKVNLHSGGVRHDANIWWSGFYSQGDGACFEGVYDYKADAAQKIREHAPQDEDLHRIVDGLARVQGANGYGLRAIIVLRDNHYCHSRTCSIEVIDRRDELRSDELICAAENDMGELMVSLMDWLYDQLKKQNDYLNSDEYIDDMIEANQYEFDEDGDRI